jgi:hypothetical protein
MRRVDDRNEAEESMQHILVYADSLSWGIVPGSRERLGFDQRWPGVMEIRMWWRP